MPRRLALLLPVTLAAACAALKDPDSSNLVSYCTAESGYRVGYLGKAYYGVCPKETEAAFLTGLQRGRGYRPNPPQVQPYYERMDQTEKQLLGASTEAERARLRTQLRDTEWWAVHIINDSGTYMTAN
ncbi:MAG TPA: DUF2799 domain-containing protein [Burkholderiales bacterium]|jgi:hypothetical protein